MYVFPPIDSIFDPIPSVLPDPQSALADVDPVLTLVDEYFMVAVPKLYEDIPETVLASLPTVPSNPLSKKMPIIDYGPRNLIFQVMVRLSPAAFGIPVKTDLATVFAAFAADPTVLVTSVASVIVPVAVPAASVTL